MSVQENTDEGLRQAPLQLERPDTTDDASVQTGANVARKALKQSFKFGDSIISAHQFGGRLIIFIESGNLPTDYSAEDLRKNMEKHPEYREALSSLFDMHRMLQSKDHIPEPPDWLKKIIKGILEELIVKHYEKEGEKIIQISSPWIQELQTEIYNTIERHSSTVKNKKDKPDTETNKYDTEKIPESKMKYLKKKHDELYGE